MIKFNILLCLHIRSLCFCVRPDVHKDGLKSRFFLTIFYFKPNQVIMQKQRFFYRCKMGKTSNLSGSKKKKIHDNVKTKGPEKKKSVYFIYLVMCTHSLAICSSNAYVCIRLPHVFDPPLPLCP